MPYGSLEFSTAAQNGAKEALGILRNGDGFVIEGLAGKVDYLLGDRVSPPDDRYGEDASEIAVATYIRGVLQQNLEALAPEQQAAAEIVIKYLKDYFEGSHAARRKPSSVTPPLAMDSEAFEIAKAAISDLPRNEEGKIAISGITQCLDYLFGEHEPIAYDGKKESRAQVAVALSLRETLKDEERYLDYSKHRPAAQKIIQFLDTYIIPAEELPPPFIPEKVPERSAPERLSSIRLVGIGNASLTPEQAGSLSSSRLVHYNNPIIDAELAAAEKQRRSEKKPPITENIPAGALTVAGTQEDIDILAQQLERYNRYVITRQQVKGRPALEIAMPIIGDVDMFGTLSRDLLTCAFESQETTNLRFFPLMAAPYIERDGKELRVGAVVDFAPRYDIPLELQKTFYDLAMDNLAKIEFFRVREWSEKCGFGRIKLLMLDGDLGDSMRLPQVQDLKPGAIIGGDPGKDTIRGVRYGFELIERYTAKTAAERVAHEIAKIVSCVYNIEVCKSREIAK